MLVAGALATQIEARKASEIYRYIREKNSQAARGSIILTFPLGVVHGDDRDETGSDTCLDEAKEESLNHDAGIVGTQDCHDNSKTPCKNQNGARSSKGKALGSETD